MNKRELRLEQMALVGIAHLVKQQSQSELPASFQSLVDTTEMDDCNVVVVKGVSLISETLCLN